MSSPNLAAPHVAAAQNQKEVTLNDATDALDLALTASAVIDCSAGGSVAVALATLRRALRLVLEGTPAQGFVLALPGIMRALILRNDTGVSALVQRPGGATTLPLAPGAEIWVYCSPGDVHLISPPLPARVYDFGMLAGPAPQASAVLGKLVLARAMTLPAGLAGARAHVDTPPQAPYEIAVLGDGALLGTVLIAPDGSASFSSASAQPAALAPGSVIRFLAPATPDPAISGIAITLAGELL